MRRHIYQIYGLVRLADEIVDSYGGPDQRLILDQLEADVIASLKTGYSSNLITHAFAQTARTYGIGEDLIKPFFASMRQDISTDEYKDDQLKAYIYGSAEVVGLMCLKVFLEGDNKRYIELAPGAKALGSAFQKVNFLRDLAADHTELGRTYISNGTWEDFDDTAKKVFESEIQVEFDQAAVAIRQLPPSAQPAVKAAYTYYVQLFRKLQATPVAKLKRQRIRLPASYKLLLLSKVVATNQLNRMMRK